MLYSLFSYYTFPPKFALASPPSKQLHSIWNFSTSNVTGSHRGPKWKLRAGYTAPPPHPHPMCCHSYFCYWTSFTVTHVILCIIEYGIAHFLCAMRVCEVQASSSSPRLPFVPKFVSFAASVAELACGEKLRTQWLCNPYYLMPWELKLSLQNNMQNSLDSQFMVDYFFPQPDILHWRF